MLGDQRPQLVLDRVVLGVRDRRRAAVVGVAQRRDLVGEFLDALPGAHPPNATRAARHQDLRVVFTEPPSASYGPRGRLIRCNTPAHAGAPNEDRGHPRPRHRRRRRARPAGGRRPGLRAPELLARLATRTCAAAPPRCARRASGRAAPIGLLFDLQGPKLRLSAATEPRAVAGRRAGRRFGPGRRDRRSTSTSSRAGHRALADRDRRRRAALRGRARRRAGRRHARASPPARCRRARASTSPTRGRSCPRSPRRTSPTSGSRPSWAPTSSRSRSCARPPTWSSCARSRSSSAAPPS